MRKLKRKGFSMQKLRELLRLTVIAGDLSDRQIAISLRSSPSKVGKYKDLIKKHDISYEIALDMTDSELKELITPDTIPKDPKQQQLELETINKELKKKHVT